MSSILFALLVEAWVSVIRKIPLRLPELPNDSRVSSPHIIKLHKASNNIKADDGWLANVPSAYLMVSFMFHRVLSLG